MIRAEKYQATLPARAIHRIPSATFTGRTPVAMAQTFHGSVKVIWTPLPS